MGAGTITRRRTGVSIVEAAIGVGIMGLMMGSMSAQQAASARRDRVWAAAERLRELHGWTTRFLDAGGVTLQRSLPVGEAVSMAVSRDGPGEGSLPSLEESGFVPEGYRDANSFGHRHAIVLRQFQGGNLTALVMQVEGRDLSDAEVGQAMQRLGAVGGGRLRSPIKPSDAALILGQGGGWSLPAAEWTAGGVQLRPGRAAARATLVTGARLRSTQPGNSTTIGPAGPAAPALAFDVLQ